MLQSPCLKIGCLLVVNLMNSIKIVNLFKMVNPEDESSGFQIYPWLIDNFLTHVNMLKQCMRNNLHALICSSHIALRLLQIFLLYIFKV